MCGTSPGSFETLEDQVFLPIKRRVERIDKCIHKLVAALNAGEVTTVASCCGHGKGDGAILLLDRTKWNEKRLLRFDIREILDRRETTINEISAGKSKADSRRNKR